MAGVVGDLREFARRDEPALHRRFKPLRHVGLLHEAEVHLDPRQSVGERRDRDALLVGYARRLRHGHGDQQHVLVQHAVELEVLRQCKRHALGHAPEHHGGAGDAGRLFARDAFDKLFAAQTNLEAHHVHDFLAGAPSEHEKREHERDQQREPAALDELGGGGDEEQKVEREQAAVDRVDEHGIIFTVQGDEGRHQGRDRHQQRHRNAESAGERLGGAEADHCDQRPGGERPVHERHVDLADLGAGGVHDVHAREEPELDRLLGERIGAGDDRLRRDHGRERGEGNQRVVRPGGGELIERALERAGLHQQQAALAEIIERERGQGDGEPGDADREATEMAHVGVERLAAGHRQERAADHRERQRSRVREVSERRQRTERREDRGRAHDADDADDADDHEPHQHDRAEDMPDPGGAVALDQEQQDENRDGQRHHDALELRRMDLQPLDGAEHRNRRRDGAVAVEQGGAEEADHHHRGAAATLLGASRTDQGEQRQDAAFAVVVGAHDQDSVFDRDDDDQRPEDQRDDADHGFRRDLSGLACCLGGDAERVERARADVAEHHAHAGEHRGRPRLMNRPISDFRFLTSGH